jgi:hypothetical protein
MRNREGGGGEGIRGELKFDINRERGCSVTMGRAGSVDDSTDDGFTPALLCLLGGFRTMVGAYPGSSPAVLEPEAGQVFDSQDSLKARCMKDKKNKIK